MILVDTSAWIEFVRGTGSAVHQTLRALVEADDDRILTTEVVLMELLAGEREERAVARIRDMLAHFELVPAEGLVDYNEAASIYRACRRRGETLRSLLDCVIAAVAIRVEASVLHLDRDFDAIARHTTLELVS